MFKNIITYAIPSEWSPNLTLVEEALTRSKFVECGASQEKSIGWVEPRGEKNGPLLESVGGQWLFKLQTETKVHCDIQVPTPPAIFVETMVL